MHRRHLFGEDPIPVAARTTLCRPREPGRPGEKRPQGRILRGRPASPGRPFPARLPVYPGVTSAGHPHPAAPANQRVRGPH